jgi:hypothetical protein
LFCFCSVSVLFLFCFCSVSVLFLFCLCSVSVSLVWTRPYAAITQQETLWRRWGAEVNLKFSLYCSSRCGSYININSNSRKQLVYLKTSATCFGFLYDPSSGFVFCTYCVFNR